MNKKLWISSAITLGLACAPFAGGLLVQAVGSPVYEPAGQAEYAPEAVPAFSNQPVKYGDKGSDVYELQGRLKFLGFFNGKTDSHFGNETLNAVKWFQWEFGLKADGVAGPQTKVKLYNATTAWRPTQPINAPDKTAGDGGNAQGGGNETALASSNTMGLTENELKIMANAVYGEARGEPFEGQVAVAAVILNRVKSPSFPNTPSGVIFQPRAFTAVADGQIYLEPNEQARKAVQQALNGWDPSGGCLYYFNPRTATSPWIWTRPQVITIGEHIFCM